MTIKVPCGQCGENLEFESEHVGTTVSCPHCGKNTRLGAGNKPSSLLSQGSKRIVPPPLSGNFRLSNILLGVIAMLLALLAIVEIWPTIQRHSVSVAIKEQPPVHVVRETIEWDYKVVDGETYGPTLIRLDPNDEKKIFGETSSKGFKLLENLLNELGKSGWELVLQSEAGRSRKDENERKIALIFKRKK
jgi:hypothetical protein